MSDAVEVACDRAAPKVAIPLDVPADVPSEYGRRLDRLREQLHANGLSYAVVYGDREHSANLQYLTGYDPRFEEAVLVVGLRKRSVLLVGNEGRAFGARSPIDPSVVNVREFSLPGQPWHDAVPLKEALNGLELTGQHTGVIGWKPFDHAADDRFDVPSYVIDALRNAVGANAQLRNATSMLSTAPGGLRTRCSALEIAQFEFSARLSSQAVQNGLDAVAVGTRELDIAAALALPALPLTMHPIVASGDRVTLGVVSATERRIEHGDPVVIAVGYRGALNARAGIVLSAEEAGSSLGRRYLDALAGPYLDALAAWHATVTVGVTGAEVHDAVVAAIGGRFELALNPGHLIHLEEWLDGPIRAGSDVSLESGMVIQCDMIPLPPAPGLAINAEDTLALADSELRGQLEDAYPQLWRRAQQRRATIESMFAIDLAPEIVPLSDLAGRVAPFLCSPKAFLALRGGRHQLAAAP